MWIKQHWFGIVVTILVVLIVIVGGLLAWSYVGQNMSPNGLTQPAQSVATTTDQSMSTTTDTSSGGTTSGKTKSGKKNKGG